MTSLSLSRSLPEVINQFTASCHHPRGGSSKVLDHPFSFRTNLACQQACPQNTASKFQRWGSTSGVPRFNHADRAQPPRCHQKGAVAGGARGMPCGSERQMQRVRVPAPPTPGLDTVCCGITRGAAVLRRQKGRVIRGRGAEVQGQIPGRAWLRTFHPRHDCLHWSALDASQWPVSRGWSGSERSGPVWGGRRRAGEGGGPPPTGPPLATTTGTAGDWHRTARAAASMTTAASSFLHLPAA